MVMDLHGVQLVHGVLRRQPKPKLIIPNPTVEAEISAEIDRNTMLSACTLHLM